MIDYFADSGEEKFFRCAHCGASLVDGDAVISSPSKAVVAGFHTHPDSLEDDSTDASDFCEIICTECGQHLGVLAIEEETDDLVPLWI